MLLVYLHRQVGTSRDETLRLKFELPYGQLNRERFISRVAKMAGKGNRLRFSREEDELLIREIGGHPCLYDMKNKYYKDIHVRDNTWAVIAEIVGKPGKQNKNKIICQCVHCFSLVAECKTRWKSLKDVYLKKKKEAKQGTGSAARNIKKWDHSDALSFLDNVERCRKTVTNVVEDSGTPDIERSENVQEEIEELNLNENDELQKEVEIDTASNASSIQTEQMTEITNPDTRKYIKKRKTSTEKILDTISKRSEERMEIFKKMESLIKSPTESTHPVKKFFESMAETVMTFPPHLIVCAKKRVLEVISELELENYNSRTSTHSSTSPSTYSSAPSECLSQSGHPAASQPAASQPAFPAAPLEYDQQWTIDHSTNLATNSVNSSTYPTCAELFARFDTGK